MIVELPFSHSLRRMNGIHLVKDGGLNVDTYRIEIEKLPQYEEWTILESTPHDCINSSEDCKRCSNNDTRMYHYLKLDNEHVYVRHIDDQIGSQWSDFEEEGAIVPAK